MYCSNRGRRNGCGRTFPIFLADVLPRHSVTATALWLLLLGMLTGASLRDTFHRLRLPFALETLYGICRRLRRRLDALRTLLCQLGNPPPCDSTDPLLATIAHFQTCLDGNCLQKFQLHFQRAIFG